MKRRIIKNKNKIILTLLIITLSVIIVIVYLFIKKEVQIQNNNKEDFNINTNIQSNISENIDKIKEKSNFLNISDVAFSIDNIEITNLDIKIESDKLLSLSDETKENLAKTEEPIIEIAKNIVAENKAKGMGFTISENQITKFTEIATKLYENSNKIISKDEYIKKWVEIQQREDLSNLFMAETTKKIS